MKGDVHFEKGLMFVLLFICLCDQCVACFDLIVSRISFFKRSLPKGSGDGFIERYKQENINSEQFFFTALQKGFERVFVAVASYKWQKWHLFVEANTPYLAVLINEKDNYPMAPRLCNTENIQLLRPQGSLQMELS